MWFWELCFRGDDGEDRQYIYAVDASQSSSQKLNFPWSLGLEAACRGVNNVVKNWCKVEFSEA